MITVAAKASATESLYLPSLLDIRIPQLVISAMNYSRDTELANTLIFQINPYFEQVDSSLK